MELKYTHTKISVHHLTPHQQTALLVLCLRAKESQKKDGLIKDRAAEEMAARIDHEFQGPATDRRSQRGIGIRTAVFDRETAVFIKRHPRGTIVNLGAGLDTRFFRVDNGTIGWFDLDLPDMIDLRRIFLQESERFQFIPSSVFDTAWMDMIPKSQPVLFLAEGLFIYFDETDVHSVITGIARRFPGAEILLDSSSPFLLDRKFPGINPELTPFKWAVSSLRELEQWDPRIRFEEEFFFSERDVYGYELFADLLGLMVRPDSKVGRISIVVPDEP